MRFIDYVLRMQNLLWRYRKPRFVAFLHLRRLGVYPNHFLLHGTLVHVMAVLQYQMATVKVARQCTGLRWVADSEHQQ